MLSTLTAASRQILSDVRHHLNPKDLVRPLSRQDLVGCLRNTAILASAYAIAYFASSFAMEQIVPGSTDKENINREIPSLATRCLAVIPGIVVSFPLIYYARPYLTPFNADTVIRLHLLFYMAQRLIEHVTILYHPSPLEAHGKLAKGYNCVQSALHWLAQGARAGYFPQSAPFAVAAAGALKDKVSSRTVAWLL